MSALVLLHPRMRADAIAQFVAERDMIIERVGDRMQARAKNDEDFAPVCTCEACRWAGLEPLYIDTGTTFNPPRGDIPRCPVCGSFALVFHIFEGTP